METKLAEIQHELTELKINETNYVTQDECEHRRNELRKNFDKLQEELSKTIGISRVHTQQIGMIQDIFKWIAGIAAAFAASSLFDFIRRVIN